MKYESILDPFCNICGKYKGIGFCKDINCAGYLGEEAGSDYIIVSSHSGKQNRCLICEKTSIVNCKVCNQGFCIDHASGMDSSSLINKDQHIGTCSICLCYVCENCWILNASGALICLNHMENNEYNADE